MTDKTLVIIFIIAAMVCIYSIVQYLQKQTHKYFIAAAISGLICSACFLWVYYDF